MTNRPFRAAWLLALSLLALACESSTPQQQQPAAPPRIAPDARNDAIAHELIMLRTRDRAIRAQYAGGDAAARQELRELGQHNAARLRQIVEAPDGREGSTSGDEAARAAWELLQAADAMPEFQRMMVAPLAEVAAAGEIPQSEYDAFASKHAATP